MCSYTHPCTLVAHLAKELCFSLVVHLETDTPAGLIAGGFLHKGSSVWSEGRPDWQPISDIPELAHLLAAAAFERPTAASHSSRVAAASRASGASGGAAGAAAAR